MRNKSGQFLKWLALVVVLGLGIPLAPYPIALIYSSYYGDQYYLFENEIKSAYQEVNKILYNKGMCKNLDTCTVMGPLSLHRERQGFMIKIFGIEDPIILEQITHVFTTVFNETPSILHMEISAYNFSNSQASEIDNWFKDPILNVQMRRKK